MERSQAERRLARRRFTLSSKKLEELISQNDKPGICVEFNKFKNLYENLSTIQNKIVNIWLDNEERDETLLDQDVDAADAYDTLWYTIEQKVKYTIEVAEADDVSEKTVKRGSLVNGSNAQASNENRRLRLPKLELPKFNGEIKKWLGFWAQFQKIDGDGQIDDEDKFQYLLQSMEYGTSARELVESFPPSATNYPKVVKQLKERFARDEILIEHYVRELLQLVLQNKNSPNISTRSLYDKLMTQIMALESLGVIQDKYAAFLFPMVESALPIDVLRAWNRSHSENDKNETQLSDLLKFVKREVESEERIHMARSGFSNLSDEPTPSTPSAACFTTKSKREYGQGKVKVDQAAERLCLWCGKTGHSNSECVAAVNMSIDERKDVLKRKNACFICLNPGHNANKCRKFPKCIICKKRHYPIMCMSLARPSAIENDNNKVEQSILNQSASSMTILIQTLKLNIVHNNQVVTVRALLDTGAQRSFIKKDIIDKLKITPIGEQQISHTLFGGIVTKKETQRLYELSLSGLDGKYQMKMEAFEQKVIYRDLPKVHKGKLLSQLQQKGIQLTDCINDVTEISLLIGCDFLGSISTGREVRMDDKLVAVETKLGWTVYGPMVDVYCSTVNNVSTLACSFDVDDLWKLETLGIKDESDVKTQKILESEVVDFFKSTIRVNKDKRYEVKLPWKNSVEDLSTNYDMALKRLNSTTLKLTKLGILDDYNKIFEEWLQSGIIEEVVIDDRNKGHYMPHHAVVKESSLTTKIRPVFDASAITNNGFSLNSCLEKGSNLIELIPRLLIDFRKNAVGITADIKKAFLQISVNANDREYLKFLWWRDPHEPDTRTLKTFRHCRVVFGVTTSPFLLSATILYHLEKFDSETAAKLKKCFYVDNCVLSVNTETDMYKFIQESKEILSQGKFELRSWVTGPIITNREVVNISVLGLVWDPKADELYCNVPFSKMHIESKVTKRSLLSFAQSIFDPMGFVCPTTLVPKLIIQKCWIRKIGWDIELPTDLTKNVKDWLAQVKLLERCRIPRRFSQANVEFTNNTLHVFSDASQSAYSSCIFLRSELDGLVTVQLILAKSRVTPTKPVTMPRLELIAALLATRLASEAKEGLNFKCREYYWTDSSIVLAWIKKKFGLNVFVHNRVKEIVQRTNVEDWRHIPGEFNPADLPSRGCNAQHLLESRWWEGPDWLKLNSAEWPDYTPVADEVEVCKEIKKCLLPVQGAEHFSDRLTYFGKYSKIVRMLGWCIRFAMNCRRNCSDREYNDLSIEEFKEAECRLFLLLQKESSDLYSKLNMKTFKDENNIIRVKTRLTLSQDTNNFIAPILLPSKDVIVERLVAQKHIQYLHAGSQTLISNLREDYWIVSIRRLAKKIVRQCIVCKRHSAKACTVPPVPLPLNRIHCGAAFEVTGIDLAGPLYLKSGEKGWIVLFTCATYRAVHLELTMSLSTDYFLLALRRFLARRGRVRVIYSDNGTNFRGASNLFGTINWPEISKRTLLNKIEWRFIPPQAPWWGGFWERMVRSLKGILRRILGNASLQQVEMYTIICEVEAILNARPLTYIAEDTENLKPLTPSMFLQAKVPDYDTTDLDYIDRKSLTVRVRYMRKLMDDLKERFRKEYLSLLIEKASTCKSRDINVGALVLIGCDEAKRINWPLGLVTEIFPGVDGACRVAKVKTANSERIRPYQRLYPLELMSSTTSNEVASPPSANTEIMPNPEGSTLPQRVTRVGRIVRIPHRLDL